MAAKQSATIVRGFSAKVRGLRDECQLTCETLQRLWLNHLVYNAFVREIYDWIQRMCNKEVGANDRERSILADFAKTLLAVDSGEGWFMLSCLWEEKRGTKAGNYIKGWSAYTYVLAVINDLTKQFHSLLDQESSDARDQQLDALNVDRFAALNAMRAIKQAQTKTWFPLLPLFAGLPKQQRVRIADCGLSSLPSNRPNYRVEVVQSALAYASSQFEIDGEFEAELRDWAEARDTLVREAVGSVVPYLTVRDTVIEFLKGRRWSDKSISFKDIYDWFSATPQLTQWRNPSATFQPLPSGASFENKNEQANRRNFFAANPELRELINISSLYEGSFATEPTKPQMSPPDAVHHPVHPRLASSNWGKLVLPGPRSNRRRNKVAPDITLGRDLSRSFGRRRKQWRGSVELPLMSIRRDPDGMELVCKYTPVNFTADSRFGKLKRIGDSFFKVDRRTGKDIPISLASCQLIVSKPVIGDSDSVKRAEFHIFFPVKRKREKGPEWLQPIREFVTKGPKKARKGVEPSALVAPGLITCSYVYDVRGDGWFVARRSDTGQILSDCAVDTDDTKGGTHPPSVHKIADERRRVRHNKKRWRHIDHMGDDRVQKVASRVIDMVVNVRASNSDNNVVLVLEYMKGFRPKARWSSIFNRLLMSGSRGELLGKIKELAEDAAVPIPVFELSRFNLHEVGLRDGEQPVYYVIKKGEDDKKQIVFCEPTGLNGCPVKSVQWYSSCERLSRRNPLSLAGVNLCRRLTAPFLFGGDPRELRANRLRAQTTELKEAILKHERI